MIKIVKNITIVITMIIIIYTSLLIITKPNYTVNKIDNILYKITGNYYLTNPNKRINKDEVIAIAKNKDYSQSIYYPYFELLNNNQKIIYQEIIDNTNKYNTTFYSSADFNENDLKEAIEAVLYDHPELFWLDMSYSGRLVPYNNFFQYKIELKFTNAINDIYNAKKEFNREINKIVIGAKKYKTDYEKELYVHDTLINIIDYDESVKTNQNAYDAIISKKAVCAGYAKLFQIIMMKLEIPTYFIIGYSNGNHSWNLVELEDGFYNVDLTWDDRQDNIIYKYFNVDDKIIESDHIKRGLSTKIIRKNGKKYINKLSPLYQ